MGTDLDRRRGFLARVKRSPLAASVATAIGVAAATLVARPITIGDVVFAPNVEVSVECVPMQGQRYGRCLNSYTLRIGEEASLIFSSNWTTGTGTTDAVLRDTGGDGWTTRSGDTYEEVVTVASLPGAFGDAPPPETSGNVIRYEYTNAGGDAQMEVELDGTLAVGQDYWIRYYTRVDSGVYSSGNAHYEVADIFQYQSITFNSPDANGNGSYYFPTMRTEGGPEATPGDDDYNFNRWRGGYDPVGDTVWSDSNLLQDGSWYRMEFHVDFLGDSINNPGPSGGPTGGTVFRSYGSWTDEGADCEFRIYPRIYSAAGTLIMDADDYGQDEYGSGPTNAPNGNTWSLQEYYDEGGTFLCIDGSPSLPGYTAVRRPAIGNNGSTSGGAPASDGSQYWYHMNYAVSTSGWIGAN